MKRRPLTILGVAALLGSAAAVTGFATSLRVDSGTIDTFTNDEAAATTTTTSPVAGGPALTSLEMFDVNQNGKVDQVKATFDKTLAPYSAGNAPWTLTSVPSGGSLSTVSVSGSIATLTLTEGGGAADTAIGDFTIALAQNEAGIRDADGKKSSFSATPPTDKAAPARIGMEMFDVSTAGSGSTPNGKIDRVVVTFSEPLAPYQPTQNPWTLAAIPSNGSLASADPVSGTTAQLNITEGTGTANTAVGSFTVALGANAGGIRDEADNLSSFTAASPADKAGPVPLSLVMANGGTVGVPDKGDTQRIFFSEVVAPGSICPGQTSSFTLANNDDNLEAQLTDGSPEKLTYSSSKACSSALSVGSVALGTGDYFNDVNNPRTFGGTGSNRTEVSWTAATSELVLKLGNRGSGSMNPSNSTAHHTATYTPSSSMTDAAGNPAVGSTTFTQVQF